MKGYVIAEAGPHQAEGQAILRARLPGLVERHAGRILLQGAAEGGGRIAAVAFPSLAEARAFAASVEVRELAVGGSLRVFAEDAEIVPVEGLRPEQLTSENHD